MKHLAALIYMQVLKHAAEPQHEQHNLSAVTDKSHQINLPKGGFVKAIQDAIKKVK